MACPYLKSVAMLYCAAYPVKKLVPRDRMTAACPCQGDFESCPFFNEISAQVRAMAAAGHAPACAVLFENKEKPK